MSPRYSVRLAACPPNCRRSHTWKIRRSPVHPPYGASSFLLSRMCVGLLTQRFGTDSHCAKIRDGHVAPPSRMGGLSLCGFRTEGRSPATVGRPFNLRGATDDLS